MIRLASRLYTGTVVHKRTRPRTHGFSYRVFALCLDLDEIDLLADKLRLFSRNARNLVSIRDSDFGDGSSESIAARTRRVLESSGLSGACARIELLCYPRLMGYAFNPLSVYFCHGGDGGLKAIIYEVTNTFAERRSYVIPVESTGGIVSQRCAKGMYVSPFTKAQGEYSFHVKPPSGDVVVGVAFRDAAGPVLKTHFRGECRSLGDARLLSTLVRYPAMTLKVIAGIHIEAARLWMKGVPVVQHHASPRYSVSVISGEQSL
jgi:hypothetical protein